MPGTIPPDAITSADAHDDIRPMRITHPLPRGWEELLPLPVYHRVRPPARGIRRRAEMSDPADTMRTMPAHVLDGLDPEQRLVAEALTGPVVVLAGAGTGKTRAITHRIAHAVQTGTHAAGNGLAVTFTNRAAGEMRQRLAGLGVQAVSVRTFHAAALSQLRYFWPTAVGGQFPDLVSSKAGLVGQACREIGLPSGRAAGPRPRHRDRVGRLHDGVGRGLRHGCGGGRPACQSDPGTASSTCPASRGSSRPTRT